MYEHKNHTHTHTHTHIHTHTHTQFYKTRALKLIIINTAKMKNI